MHNMDDDDGSGYEFILEKSLCKKCTHRFSRLIAPFDVTSYGLNDDAIEELEELQEDVDGDSRVVVEEHMCLLLSDVLDGAVLTCSKFDSKKKAARFLSTDLFV